MATCISRYSPSRMLAGGLMKTCYWPKAQSIQSYIPYLILLANKVAVNRGANGLDWTAAMRGQTQDECIADARNKMNSCLDKAEEKTTACKAKGYPDGERRCTMFKHGYQHMCRQKFVSACQWARTAGDASPMSRFCWNLISSTKASLNTLIFCSSILFSGFLSLFRKLIMLLC